PPGPPSIHNHSHRRSPTEYPDDDYDDDVDRRINTVHEIGSGPNLAACLEARRSEFEQLLEEGASIELDLGCTVPTTIATPSLRLSSDVLGILGELTINLTVSFYPAVDV
ncbi:MAG: hypothetical protein AB1938_27285, partial [Myxococcota bacterium]